MTNVRTLIATRPTTVLIILKLYLNRHKQAPVSIFKQAQTHIKTFSDRKACKPITVFVLCGVQVASAMLHLNSPVPTVGVSVRQTSATPSATVLHTNPRCSVLTKWTAASITLSLEVPTSQ